ncbi:MAG: globin [Spirochaetales bacterium]|nr:hypothetical protein [Leptospiraceae bacterium]MCP5483511.1 globin [Spirochaetales bacterium]MCP5486737.1 globin [Spirochaetales bacterium]
MSPKQLAQKSFVRVLGLRGPEFFDDFYRDFLGRSPEIKSKFAGTDMERQREVLRASFYHMFDYFETRRPNVRLEEMARRHARNQLDIPPSMYDEWLNCLLGLLRQHDPGFDAAVEEAWKAVVMPVIEYMRGLYE